MLVLGLDRDGHVVSSGSGVVVSAGNLVVTSQQAIQGASQLAVRHANGTAGPAPLVSSDPSLGLAIVRADTGPLPVAPVGSAALAQAGDSVSAHGFRSSDGSLGESPVMSTGHLTEAHWVLRAQSPGMAPEMAFTASAEPGFSGGPLFNSAGELIGVITRPAPAAATGAGVAVPIDRARDLISRARSGIQSADPATPIPAPAASEKTASALTAATEITALVEQYYGDLNAGDYRATYDILSESARRAQSFSAYQAQFRALVAIEAGQPLVAGLSADQAIVQIQTMTTSRAGPRLVRQPWQLTWYLIREGGSWRRVALDQRPLADPTPVNG